MKSRIVPIVVAAGTVGAHAAVPQEISEDARRVASPGGEAAAGSAARGSTLPFPAAPDFEVNLRRQVAGLAIEDMDGDGRNDLVAVCYISNSFPPYDDWREMIFFNGPDGLATTPGWVSDNETHAGDVQVGDVNSDGFPDIVVVRGGGIRPDSVQVYFGAQGGPSTSPGYSSNVPNGAWGTSGELVDIDIDGDLDLVTTNQGIFPDSYRPMAMFRNDGAGFGTIPAWQSAAAEISNGVDSADLDADGLPDIAAAKWVNFRSGVYLNDGGTPAPSPAAAVPAEGSDKGAAIGDVDLDGEPEVVFGGDPTTLFEFQDGMLEPIYQANPPFSGPQEVRLHDVGGDGDLDLAEVHFADGRAHIYENNGGVLDTTPTWSFDAPEVGSAIVFGDLNGDGRDDLAVGYSGDVCIRVFYAEAPDCPADLAPPFGVLDLADVQAFIAAFNSQDPIADLTGDGVWDLDDLQAFLASFNAGCP